ncbi:MAG TPA: hypothetical protein VMF35_09060 [Acidimicrobiales bacterium]|nr:hypothetical protein [Acidimicrobiales bacterium]
MNDTTRVREGIGAEDAPPAATDALIKEARARQRRRWRITVGSVVATASLVAVAAVALVGTGSPTPQRSPDRPAGSGAVPARAGVAVGIAVPCAGPMFVPTAHLWVYRGAQLVAYRAVPTGATFRFVLRPGAYVISNDGDPRQPGLPPGNAFAVHAGATTHVVVLNYCS